MLDLRTTKNPRGLGERIGNALTYVVKMRYLYLMCIPGLIYLFIFHLHAHVRRDHRVQGFLLHKGNRRQ